MPAWLTAAGIKAFSFVAPLSAPYSYMAPGVGGWMILGVICLICLIYLYVRDPRRVTEVGLVHLDDELWQGYAARRGMMTYFEPVACRP